MVFKDSELVKKELQLLQETVADLAVATFSAEAGRYSATLAGSFTRTPLDFTRRGFRTTITTPFFWARILDEGHGVIRPRRAKTLFWFANPLRDDPRLQGSYYKTELEASSRRLTRADLKKGRENGTLRSAKVVPAFEGYDFADAARASVRKEVLRLIPANVRASVLRSLQKLDGNFQLQVTF